MLVNSRPSFKNPDSVILHFRELEGQSAALTLESKIAARPVKRMVEVNSIGKETGNSLSSISLKPFEVKFVEVDF
jgi:hypothetical protein